MPSFLRRRLDGTTLRFVGDLPGTVTALAEDRQGVLWAVANAAPSGLVGRLYRLQNGRFHEIRVRPEGAAAGVGSVGTTHDGRPWVSGGFGVYVYRFESNEFKVVPDLVLDANTEPIRDPLRWIWSVAQDRSGQFWVTDAVSGFRSINSVVPRDDPDLTGDGYRLLYDRDGSLWVATVANGLWRVTHDKVGRSTVARVPFQPGVLSDSVQSLFEDRSGNLWAGSTSGLHRLSKLPATPLPSVGRMVAIEGTPEGDIWTGGSGGLYRLSYRNGEWITERITSPDIYVLALHRDRRGVLWIGSVQGLSKLENGRVVGIDLPEVLASRPINCLSSDAAGSVWVGDGRRVLRWTGRSFEPPGWSADNLPTDAIDCVFNDSRGRLWVRSDVGARVRPPNGSLTRVTDGPFGTGNVAVSDISESPDGTIWLSTSAGVSRIKGNQVSTFNSAHGLPTDRVDSVTDDGEGHVWIHQDVGVLRIRYDEFDRALATSSYRLRYRLFDARDGIAGAPITRLRSALIRRGRVVLQRGGALTVIDTKRVDDPNDTTGPVRIESADVDGSRTLPEAGIGLAANVKRLAIAYSAIDLTSPQRLRFRYRLNGFDTDWTQAPDAQLSAVYTNLPPRAYEFTVQVGSDSEGWNSDAATWRFHIRPSFTQAPWFHGLVVVTLVLGAAGAWRVRMALMRKQYAAVLSERTRLARELHDTLLQGLAGAALQLDSISKDAPTRTAGRLQRIAAQLEAYMREARHAVLELRAPVLENRTLSAALRSFGEEAVMGTGATFTFSEVGSARHRDCGVETELLRIAQEAIVNAVRHSQARQICAALSWTPAAVSITVRDDGQGFQNHLDRPMAGGHFGVTSMKERAERLGGHLRIRRTPDGHTEVEATVPLPVRADVA